MSSKSKNSGRIVKSRKGKTGTPHQKNHRWESFSTKISKLHSLDPLRKVRRHDLDVEDLQATTSYFRNGLEKWADLNISKDFTSFRREVMPLCESLPQILHFETKIMELLAKYISIQEKESLEALLELLTAFAHDLGTRFEKHYPTALNLITEIASRPQDAAVVEWTFACLAFLFKYLSKLLVPDLRPTYDALASLLGKARNPPHIVRFAAEALSFLVKKAAAPANREKALPILIEHARLDLESTRETRQMSLYYHGLMTTFAEAIKGHGQGVHTTGPEIVRGLIMALPDNESVTSESMTWIDLVSGVLVSIVHHTTAETFGPIAETIIDVASRDERISNYPLRNCLYIRLLGTISGVRKGNRIVDWSALLKSLQGSLNGISKDRNILDNSASSAVWQQVIVNVAILWANSPMEAVIPFITDFMNAMTREPLMKWFIPFCSYLADLDSTRFRSLFIKQFQKFVVLHWSNASNEDMLCVSLPRMVESGGLPSTRDAEGFQLPQSWQDQIVSKFERLEISPFPEQGASSTYNKDPKTWHDKCLPKYSALLRLLESTTVRPSTYGPIADILLRKLKLALRPSSSHATEEAHFIISQGFAAYLRMSKITGQIDSSIGPLLRAAAPRYHRLTGFLEAMIAYEESVHNTSSSPSRSDSSGSNENEDPLLKSLVDNLSAPSHEHRLASLKLLRKLDQAPDQLECLAIMLQTEEMPLDLQSVRAIQMHIRKLAMNYPQLSRDTWLQQAVPSFLFGMLTVRLAPVWDAAVEALSQISQTKAGEEAVSEIAFKWMENPSKRWDGPTKEATASSYHGLTDFECLNLAKLHDKARDVEHILENSPDVLLQSFEENQRLVPELLANARSQALKVFAAAPALAEKRSRRLVPYFLSWSLESEEQDSSGDDTNEAPGESWSLFDKKALLGVFSQFSNPKVLYQTHQVYKALLGQLANGDPEIQKLALKAIIPWKQDGVTPYQEALEALLDETRFKNELTLLFQGENTIQPQHRSELMPVLLRLLYGRTISKKGIASGRSGQHATRLAVLRQLNVDDMGDFLDIAMGDLRGVHVIEDSKIRENILSQDIIPVRKQVGFLRMMETMIHELGENVASYMDTILNAVLYCLVLSCRKLRYTVDEEEEDEEGEDVAQTSLHRVVRTASLKCLVSLLRQAPKFDWTAYKNIIVNEIISPRIENLPIENTQGVSGILQLISTISIIPKTALFLAIDGKIVPKLAECLTMVKTKEEVKVFALSIIRNIVTLSQKPAVEYEFNELIKEELLEPNTDAILSGISTVLKGQGDIGKDLMGACVECVVELSPMLQQSGHTKGLVDVSIYLLNQPSRRVNPRIKGSVLSMLENLLKIGGTSVDSDLTDQIYSTIAQLFGFFKDRTSREALPRVLTVLAQDSATQLEVAELCSELNAYSGKRLDEPDYGRRLKAFTAITTTRDTLFTPRDWEPLLHNMTFHIKNDEEYGILSSNSADCLCKFVEAAAAAADQDKEKYHDMLSGIVYSAIQSNVREPSETVRRENMRILGFLVSKMPGWSPVSDLVVLDPIPDDKESDPSFFSNILSPATARQMRAMQLLSKANHQRELHSRNIAHIFIPLLEHFIFDREDGSDDFGVGAQAGTTISELAISLEWPQYRAILRRYIGYIESKPNLQKHLVRLLGKIVDALSLAATERDPESMDIDSAEPALTSNKHRLASTMPSPEKFNEDVLTNILPSLLDYIHEKDETTVSSRVPVGIIIVKILKLLPVDSLNQKLPGVLTDICHILRSKAWDSREMARDTLAKMSSILGPSCLGFVFDELRGALTKGYQLHVLSYTMHTILVTVIPGLKPGDIDYCLENIVTIIMDDIFGVVGQEKDAEEYVSQMKEVKSSKSQDSMELIARTASVSHLVQLVRPLQALLLEKLDLRMVRKIDELLTRITNGLLSNPAAESRDTLVLCYEVIQRVYKSERQEAEPQINARLKRYLIQKGAKKSGYRGSTNKYTYKLIRFALDVLRSVFKKHDSLRNAGNIAGFIPILGDAIVGGEEEVRIATFKLLAVLAKVPFKTDDASKLYKVAAKEATKNISMSTSTTTDLAQTALKLVSVILRDRRDVVIKDTAVDMLLGKLKDDLTEPLYRHVTFSFLRSVLDRKVETAGVYDTLDHVGTIMITNDDKDTRDLARGAFFQFLRDYPQKKNRWAKQLAFVVANLKYEREGGRLSVMEIIHLLLMKSADDFVQEIATNCFIPLVMVLANDDSEKCRLAAGELIKEVFRKADKERTSKFLVLVRNWLGQDDNSSVLRLAVQAFALYFQAREPTSKDRKDLDLLADAITRILEDYSTFSRDAELINTVLQTIPILVDRHPAIILAHERLWRLIPTPLSHPDAAVKLSSVRLIATYLTDFYQKKNETDTTKPVTGSYGLVLDRSMIDRLVAHAVGVLNPAVISRWKRRVQKQQKGGSILGDIEDRPRVQDRPPLEETLATEVSRVIVMLATFMEAGSSNTESPESDGEEDNEEEEEEEEEDEWGGIDDEAEDKEDATSNTTLQILFAWLSDILVEEVRPGAAALIPKVSAMEIISVLAGSNTLPVAALAPCLETVLAPLAHLTDPSIPMPYSVDELYRTRYEGLRTRATETMDALQRRLGTADYTKGLLAVRDRARRRREARSRKRKVEAVSQPDRFGKWKRGRLEKKVKRRKEKGGEQRARRVAARYA
ncbi:U3 snoRNP protein [Diatrype stigma]|uniref:U3 snoRNP protein n=1 Tax=Diatrype stigma TaxID=117547 RepID=A0AAN9V1B7_9PEZI